MFFSLHSPYNIWGNTQHMIFPKYDLTLEVPTSILSEQYPYVTKRNGYES